MFSWNFWRLSCLQKRFALSGNKLTSNPRFEELWKSLIYNGSNKGPTAAPCGIAYDVLHFADDVPGLLWQLAASYLDIWSEPVIGNSPDTVAVF